MANLEESSVHRETEVVQTVIRGATTGTEDEHITILTEIYDTAAAPDSITGQRPLAVRITENRRRASASGSTDSTVTGRVSAACSETLAETVVVEEHSQSEEVAETEQETRDPGRSFRWIYIIAGVAAAVTLMKILKRFNLFKN